MIMAHKLICLPTRLQVQFIPQSISEIKMKLFENVFIKGEGGKCDIALFQDTTLIISRAHPIVLAACHKHSERLIKPALLQ